MTASPKELDAALNIAGLSAAKVAARFRGYVERADVKQELALWIVTHPRKVDEWLDVENNHERKYGERALATTLRRQAEQYCREEKAKLAGYSTLDEHFYDLGQIELMLPPVLEGTWSNPPAEEGRGPNTNPINEGGGWFAACTDLLRVLQQLPVDDYSLLSRRYADQAKLRELAGERDVSVSTVHRDIERVLHHLLDELGGKSPWNDKDRRYHRPVLSNAHAQSLLEETS